MFSQFTQSVQEEAKLDAMQRHWQHRHGGSSTTAFFEANETEDMLTLQLQVCKIEIL